MVVTRIDKLIMQSREEGLAEGKAEEKINLARKLIPNGKLTNEEIAAIVDLSLEQVNKIAEGS